MALGRYFERRHELMSACKDSLLRARVSMGLSRASCWLLSQISLMLSLVRAQAHARMMALT